MVKLLQNASRVLRFSVLALALAGCGGGGGGGAPSGGGGGTSTSRAVITINWPTRSRLVPVASESVRFVIRLGESVIGQAHVVRPAGGDTTTATLSDLTPGSYVATMNAFPSADGTGTPQAFASLNVTLVAAQTTNVTVSMNSTIDRLEMSSPTLALNSGATSSLVATPKNASGAVVLVSPATLSWTSNNPSVAAVNGSGVVTAGQFGTAVISVQETESGKSVSALVAVNLTIAVQPSSATVPLGTTRSFTAIVTGSANTAVTWSVEEGASGGTISASGLYTPPSIPGTYHMIATSVADPTKSSRATVTVSGGSASGTIQ